MESYRKCVWFCILIGAIASHRDVSCATLDDVVQLHTDLFTNYSTKRVPVSNHTETMIVNIEIYLINIINLDAVSGIIEINFAIAMQWTDYRLAWNSSSYGGLTTHNLLPSYIWHPNVYLVTTADELETFSGDDFIVNLQSTGQMQWIAGKLVKSSCVIDMTHFPTDIQICTFVVCPWGFTHSELFLSFLSNTAHLEFYSTNGEWDIVSATLEQNTFFEPIVSAVQMTLTLRRKSTYYMVSLVLPIIILIALTSGVFLIPTSSGERTSYAISMFLSLALYVSLMSTSIPEVSDPIAGISYFLLLALICSSVLLLLTIYTLRLELVETLDEFPKWIISLRRRCCFKSKKSESIANITPIEVMDKHADNVSLYSNHEQEELTVPEVRTFIDMFIYVTTTAAGVIVFIFYFGVYIRL